MSFRLAIAEKPSVAQSIAKVLGATKRRSGYLEGNGWLVSWCLGHLVGLVEPAQYEERYRTWRTEDLPIVPDSWIYEVTDSTKKQFSILKTLMNRKDVTELVECTEAGREGELIFRLVYHQCHCPKPFRRLWISSMEDTAIREGFAHLRDSLEYDALYQAALCREHADWLVGINATRFFSCLYGQTLAVGRVMTPTLSMIVTRDAEIAVFQEEPFYTVRLEIDGVTVESRKFKDKSEAERLKNACMEDGEALVLRMERKRKTKQPPALYDLTSLQRDTNRMLGFTAQQTLQYAQSLYEKKLITYPRTDSRYLTEDLAEGLGNLTQSVAAAYGMQGKQPFHAERMIDNSKVTDHHAILPTKIMPQLPLSELPSGEQSVLRLIAARLLAASGEPHRYEEMTAVYTCADTELTAKDTVVLQNGWKETEEFFGLNRKKARETSPAGSLEEFSEGTFVIVQKAEIHEGKTSPPRPYTEDLCCTRRT